MSMMMHCGSSSATIHDLAAVTLPENHDKFKDKCGRYGTVSHDRLVNSIKSMARHNFGPNAIIKEEFALSGGKVYPGAKLFGSIQMDFNTNEAEKALVNGGIAEAIDIDDVSILQKLSNEDQNIFLSMENDTARMNFLVANGVIPENNDGGNVITIRPDTIYPTIAFRNSYDRSMSVGMALGYMVFICDNLCLSGEIQFARKHTLNAFPDVVMTIWSLMQSMKGQHEFDQRWREFAKTVDLTQREGFEMLGLLAGEGMLPFVGGTKSQFALAVNQWKEPSHEVFEDRNMWSFENAITFAQRASGINKRMETGNAVVRELRRIADPSGQWNEEADELAFSSKETDKATVIDLIEVINDYEKRDHEEAVLVEQRAANIAKL